MKVEYTWTTDNLRLMGLHYPGKDMCVLVTHRMGGSFAEDLYADVLGRELSVQGYGLLYGHSRGYGQISSIATQPLKKDNGFSSERAGSAYEIFTDSVMDIEAWLKTCRQLGYKKIILMGHSLGCNKVVYYLSQRQPEEVVGVILAGPPDMHAFGEKYQPDHKALVTRAKELVAAGERRRLLDETVLLSAQTYLSLFVHDEIDTFPIKRNPETFQQLALINQPILGLMGEYDGIEIRSVQDDIELVKSKATACPDFQIGIIKGGNHYYENREGSLAKTIFAWFNKIGE